MFSYCFRDDCRHLKSGILREATLQSRNSNRQEYNVVVLDGKADFLSKSYHKFGPSIAFSARPHHIQLFEFAERAVAQLGANCTGDVVDINDLLLILVLCNDLLLILI